ncbi:holo-[acyl-carrier protein] synthase [Candidatus Pelagibacter ubique]|uniref:Holo-[acyl-carrier-protein] synthase n=1 Tax=Pelagibacter ubique TaxID=198252 RepID=A0ABX1T3B9_PELUQ|nr:holo-ACP synthase [Candidatus Pelagibacter ubique]NMN67959.1 holo-[acyl-carrier protein] synthase [Candidatus Pelagibacter ubique]
MKILGIGVDIIENSRIVKSLKNKLFIKRIFSNSEIIIAKKIKDKKTYYSNRFAAKEAFVKSIGTGFRNDLNFKDISIINNKAGKPSFIINEKIKKIVKKQFKTTSFNFFLSISDEKKYSIAYVILQKK